MSPQLRVAAVVVEAAVAGVEPIPRAARQVLAVVLREAVSEVSAARVLVDLAAAASVASAAVIRWVVAPRVVLHRHRPDRARALRLADPLQQAVPAAEVGSRLQSSRASSTSSACSETFTFGKM